VEAVGERDPGSVRAHAQRRRASAAALAPPFRGGQPQAGAGIGALRQRPVRRRGGGADLRACAEALVQPVAGPQPLDRRLVGVVAVGLEDDLAVPVQTQRPQVGELALGGPGDHAALVEVLHPHDEARARRPREQPREQRGAQVPDVEGAGRARCETPVACHPS
jgi:hypothetical protein